MANSINYGHIKHAIEILCDNNLIQHAMIGYEKLNPKTAFVTFFKSWLYIICNITVVVQEFRTFEFITYQYTLKWLMDY